MFISFEVIFILVISVNKGLVLGIDYFEYLLKQKEKLRSRTSAKWWNRQLPVLIPHRNIEKRV